MLLPWPSLLVVAAVVAFVTYLIWKLRPALPVRLGSLGRAGSRRRANHPRSAQLQEEVRRERARARTAPTSRERAQAFAAAGRASARMEDGTTAALGLYLRAMRADATSCDPVRAIIELLHDDRPELLESVLWRRLAQLAWTGETAAAARCATEGLVTLYRRDLPHRERARALQKLLALI